MIPRAVLFSLCLALLAACSGKSETSSGATRKGHGKNEVETPRPRCSGREACEAGCKPCQTGPCDAAAAVACRDLAAIRSKGRPPQFDLAAAVRLYQLACERGDLRSCAEAGNRLQDGRGVARDIQRAMTLYDRACQGGVGVGCFNLGMVYRGVVGVDRDEARATELFQRAAERYAAECDSGRDLSWCQNYGVLFEQGYGVERNPDRAAEIYRTACDKGNDDACVNGILLDLQAPDRPSPGDVQPLLTRLQTLCDRGTDLACGVLGSLLIKDQHGVPRDLARATGLLGRSCDAGRGEACLDLAAVYTLGLGGEPPDPARAIGLARHGCDLGSSDSCVAVAHLAVEGAPGTSPADQLAYFQKGCDIGNAEACGFLGAIYELGRGVAKDVERGRGYTRDACRLGYPGSCVDLIQKGIELPLPPERARFMYQGACKNGVAAACQRAKAISDSP